MSVAPPMIVKGIAPWFGGKRTLAPIIVRELGRHAQYFEPFCGSMAVLFAKEPSPKETVNDLHGGLINLARVVASPLIAETLYDRLVSTLFCESLLEEAGAYLEAWNGVALEGLNAAQRIDHAYFYFIASWMCRNGVAGTERAAYQIAVRWTKNGGSATVRWRHAVESIPAWHQRLRNVVILSRDAFRIIDRFEDCAETAIYVDPPYVHDSRSGYTNRNGDNSRYRHEFNHEATLGGPDDHQRLRDILAAYKKARVVVSYYDCPRVRELYAGWTIVEHSRISNLYAASARGEAKTKQAPEILIINGPSYAEEAVT